MLTNNPFSELAGSISPGTMQTFVIVMILLVIAGTIFDVIHKKSAKYFFDNMQRSKKNAKTVAGGEKMGIAIKTVAEDVLTSGEFCNPKRRIAHLLTMYGFILFVVSTAVMIFCYTSADAGSAGIWAVLWHIGALAVCVGGYWFWFFIRVDVAAEGNSPFRLIKADLFVLSLLATTTFALLWSFFQAGALGWLFFVLFILSTLVLFGGVPWSKFAHMFFKPAAAFEKRVSVADGTRNNLPPPADAPEKFGLGIKREAPKHY